MIRRLYDWILGWAQSPYGAWALFALAFCESSFFPIPPDALLIALGISVPKKSLKYALICSVGSVLGGALGYLIGLQFMSLIGYKIVDVYGLTSQLEYISELYRQYDAWAVGIAGFTPIPYKVFTITAGAFEINFAVFIIASAVSRTIRFVLVGLFIYIFGSKIKYFIDKYFNILALVFVVVLIAGFAAVKYLF